MRVKNAPRAQAAWAALAGAGQRRLQRLEVDHVTGLVQWERYSATAAQMLKQMSESCNNLDPHRQSAFPHPSYFLMLLRKPIRNCFVASVGLSATATTSNHAANNGSNEQGAQKPAGEAHGAEVPPEPAGRKS